MPAGEEPRQSDPVGTVSTSSGNCSQRRATPRLRDAYAATPGLRFQQERAVIKDTDEKAKAGMGRYVIVAFVIALVIGLIYFVFLTPGEPQRNEVGAVPVPSPQTSARIVQ